MMSFCHRGGDDELTLNQGSENACVDVLVTGRRREADWSCGQLEFGAESLSESPCCARTARHHSSNPTDGDCDTHRSTSTPALM